MFEAIFHWQPKLHYCYWPTFCPVEGFYIPKKNVIGCCGPDQGLPIPFRLNHGPIKNLLPQWFSFFMQRAIKGDCVAWKPDMAHKQWSRKQDGK